MIPTIADGVRCAPIVIKINPKPNWREPAKKPIGFLAGSLQLGLGFIFITIGAQRTPSAMVGIIMLTEAVLGPLWAWIFIDEQPPMIVLFGGSIVIFAVLLQFYYLFSVEKKQLNTNWLLFHNKWLLTNGRDYLICSAEGATAQESLRQKDRYVLTLERD